MDAVALASIDLDLSSSTVAPVYVLTGTTEFEFPGYIVTGQLGGLDTDFDGVQDSVDNCRAAFNPEQSYLPDHADYPGLKLRVRCFDSQAQAKASGYASVADAPPPPADQPGQR